MPAAASSIPEPAPEPEPKPEATLAETRALAHPLRLRIIRLLYDRSLTNRELARALGEHPATVLHHVRTLLRNGFIAAEPERRGPRGTIEKPYRSTGRSWSLRIDDDEGVANVSRAALEAFLAELHDAAPTTDLHTSRLAVNLTPAERDDLERKLSEVLAEYAAIGPDAEGEPWSVFVATHRRAPLADERTVASEVPEATAARRRMPPEVQLVDRAPDDEMSILLVRAQWAELTARYGVPEAEPASISKPGAFRAPTGAFVGLAVEGVAAGCGGVCEYRDPESAEPESAEPATDQNGERIGELKAIYVSPLQRGNGYGRLIVQALEVRAQRIGYGVLRLETGDAQPEAIALYRSLGYSQIERYGPYRDLVRSVCFERVLEP
jgi:DNA-binding transcriptional ArsR family regulator/GNAT superfamily N-acetyltransferase